MSNIRTQNTTSQLVVPHNRGNIPARRPQIDREKLRPPSQRGFISNPKPEILDGLIHRALEALKNGVYWERGSIINIVV